MSEGIIDAYVTNLGRYNEGELRGAYLSLPATTQDVQAVLKNAGVDGMMYEEIFITDYETDVPGLPKLLGEYENIDELNYLASVLDELNSGDMERFNAAVEYGDNTGSIKDLINLAQNLDCYDFIPGIEDDDDLGRYYIDECGALEIPEALQNYIDYEAYGRDVRLEEGGCFVDGGYVRATGDSMTEYYDGMEIPDEYRVFAYPKEERERPSVRDTIKELAGQLKDQPGRAADKVKPAAALDAR